LPAVRLRLGAVPRLTSPRRAGPGTECGRRVSIMVVGVRDAVGPWIKPRYSPSDVITVIQ